MQRFTEVSSRRRRPELLQSAKPRRMIKRLVAVCISPSVLINCWIYIRLTRERWKSSVSSTERRLEKENYNFFCVVNKLVYVTPTARDNSAHNFSRPFFASRVFLRGTFYAVLREEMEILRRAESSFDCLTAHF